MKRNGKLDFEMATLFPSTEKLLEEGIHIFKNEFKCSPEVGGVAPGRVNLIGEHTDYNEGFVFPMALPMVTIIIGRKNGTQKCRLLTSQMNADEPRKVEFSLPDGGNMLEAGKPVWANYVKGVLQYFDGQKVGFDAVIISSVPLGGGLSSSAALEVATYSFLEGLTGHKSYLKQKALICQKAEHSYAHVPCGLMDQLIVIYAEQDCATLIDCRSIAAENVKIPCSNCVFLIINSNVRHDLSTSEYSVRRKTCETVAAQLKKNSLRDVTLPEVEKLKATNSIDDVMYRRARHVISENKRTLEAVEALKNNDVKTFGQLMNSSHSSLRDDYEVSCDELDFLVDTVRQVEGVYGSRMTGGGFGGCTVTLVEKSAVNKVIETVQQTYSKKADFYVVSPSAGSQVIDLNDKF